MAQSECFVLQRTWSIVWFEYRLTICNVCLDGTALNLLLIEIEISRFNLIVVLLSLYTPLNWFFTRVQREM